MERGALDDEIMAIKPPFQSLTADYPAVSQVSRGNNRFRSNVKRSRERTQNEEDKENVLGDGAVNAKRRRRMLAVNWCAIPQCLRYHFAGWYLK